MASVHEFDVVLERLATLLAERIAARLENGRVPDPPEDHLLDARAAAERLGVSISWLKRRASTLPFSRKLSGKITRFSSRGIDRYLATRGGGR
jgi:predicted DNA-binding transcriptional regulator AlpA